MLYRIKIALEVEAPSPEDAALMLHGRLSALVLENIAAQSEAPTGDTGGYWPWQGTGDQLKQAPADHFSWWANR